MPLPKKEKSEPRPVSVSFRISQKAASNLKTLAKEHNMSQADVIDYLINQEFRHFEGRKRR